MRWEKADNCTTIEEVIARNFQIENIDEIKEWERKTDSDEYKVDRMQEACQMISQMKDKKILICGDYDVDGRTASIIMYRTLVKFGCKNVSVRIPRRFSEGYGMKPVMIDEVAEDDALIITVDNGIAAFEAIQTAKDRGMKVIVVDHHPAMVVDGVPKYPNADILIDPSAILGSATFSGYCGAGLAYKLSCELIKDKSFTNSLLPFFAIATIADVMDLREENWVLTKRGLEMMTKRDAPSGILALMDSLDITQCDAINIAFKIGPIINAPGRIKDIDIDTLKLMSVSKMESARKLASILIQINNERKELDREGVSIAERIIGENSNNDIIVVRLGSKYYGIVGIIAGKLTEKYHVPAIVFSEVGGKADLGGSCRSVPGVDITALIRSCGDIATCGGHAQAAGVHVDKSRFEEFKECITKAFADMHYEFPEVEVGKYDLEITEDMVLEELVHQSIYEPFGHGNSKPIFKISNFHLTNPPKEISGHGVKLIGTKVSAVGFGLFPLVEDMNVGTYDLYGTLSWNEYHGYRNPQIELIDFVKQDRKKTTSFASALKNM